MTGFCRELTKDHVRHAVSLWYQKNTIKMKATLNNMIGGLNYSTKMIIMLLFIPGSCVKPNVEQVLGNDSDHGEIKGLITPVNMQTKILLFITLISYTIIVSQSFSYFISLKKVQMSLQAPSYIELRQLIDASFRARFKYVVYIALLANLILVLDLSYHDRGLLFIIAIISFILLITDVMISMRGNVPINTMINTWTVDGYPSDWQTYRLRWMRFLGYRQVANITGWLVLLTGAIFNS